VSLVRWTQYSLQQYL